MQRLLFFLCICFCQVSDAQTSNKMGYVIYTLGADTTFIGYYQLRQNDFVFKVMARPNLSVSTISGKLFPNGELKEATGYSYKPGVKGEEKRLVDYTMFVNPDSTFIKQVRDGKETSFKIPGRIMLANALGTSFLFFLPVLTNYAPKKIGETVESDHYVLGQKRKFTITRTAAGILEMGSQVMGYFKIYLQPDGKLKMIDGIGTSWNVRGNVFNDLDLNAYIQKFVQREEVASLKPLNKQDSVLTTINGVDLRIDYSRPSKRGRVIFGEVVPWNRIWRTGANAPTKLALNKSIYFDGKELPAGLYSIFTLPAKDEWTLIINKQTNIWGTDYDSTFDLLRIPMKTEKLKEPLDMMTIDILHEDNKGILSISWDRLKTYATFKVNK